MSVRTRALESNLAVSAKYGVLFPLGDLDPAKGSNSPAKITHIPGLPWGSSEHDFWKGIGTRVSALGVRQHLRYWEQWQIIIVQEATKGILLVMACCGLKVCVTCAQWTFVCKFVCWSPVTESKLVLLATGHANKLRDEVLGQRIVTLFGKPADREDGGLVSQRTILPKLEFRLL